jgi:hypothetical protein
MRSFSNGTCGLAPCQNTGIMRQSGIKTDIQRLGRIICLAACALACGCAGVPVAGPKTPAVQHVSILATGNTLGVFDAEGCGCRNLGGLSRRARYVLDRRLQNPSVLVLDTGALLSREQTAPEAPVLQSDYVLGALDIMRPDAVHLDAYDRAALTRRLPEAGGVAGALLASANTPQGAGRRPLPTTIVSSVTPLSVGIFGLSSGASASPAAAADPAEAARAAVAYLRAKKCAVIILLSQLTTEQNRTLALDVPDIHLIIGSADAREVQPPEIVGSTVMFAPGSRGTHVAEMELTMLRSGAFRYDMAVRESVEKRLAELRDMEQNPPPGQSLEEIILRRVLLEEKLSSFIGQNAYRFQTHALDKTVGDEPSVALLGEQYRLDLLKADLARAQRVFVDHVPGMTFDMLSMVQRLQALRLLNELDARPGTSIARCAGEDPACRDLGRLIVAGVARGDSLDKIRFTVLQTLDQRSGAAAHIFLDKHTGLQ